MRYEFGVMSSKYELECDDEDFAKAAMCFFLKTTAPIVIYYPEECESISNPKKILDDVYDKIKEDVKKFTTCMDSIKENDSLGGLDE